MTAISVCKFRGECNRICRVCDNEGLACVTSVYC